MTSRAAASASTVMPSASRGLLHGGITLADVTWVLVTSAVIVAVFAPLSLYIYHKER